jgi:hypothetical protein
MIRYIFDFYGVDSMTSLELVNHIACDIDHSGQEKAASAQRPRPARKQRTSEPNPLLYPAWLFQLTCS